MDKYCLDIISDFGGFINFMFVVSIVYVIFWGVCYG